MNRDAETVPARHETPDLAKPGAEAGRTPLVLIESPYAGDVARNERYARACLADSLARGEAPFASHLLYTQPGVLDDTDPAERHQGIQAGLAWGANATLTAVYDDLGITEGMRQGIARAKAEGRPVEVRQLAGWDAPEPARPGETVAETVPAHHETPDVAELRRLRDTEREELHSPTRRLVAYYYSFDETGSVPIDAILSAVAIAGKSCHNTDMWTEDGEWSRWGVGRSLVDVIQCAANEAAAALLDAAAERDALAAKLGAVREWIDRRGVNVGDRDDDYMRGYRDAQRHAILDAAELRWILDAETGSES